MGNDPKSNKMFLATTALSEFWDREKTILFLGEWCKTKKNQHVRENIKWSSLNSQKTKAEPSFDTYQHTIQLYNQLLPVVVNWLNQIHGTLHSLKYWRFLIGPFLLLYTQVLYHRFLYVKEAYELYPDIDTFGLREDSYFIPINTREFCLLSAESDAWNLQLFTQLISLKFKLPVLLKAYSWELEKKYRERSIMNDVKFKTTTKIKLVLIRFFVWLRRKRAIGLVLCAHEFKKKNLIRLMFLSKFIIFPITKLNNKKTKLVSEEFKINMALRNELSSLQVDNEFLAILLKTLKFNMPTNFIENYQASVKQSLECFPYSLKVMVGTSWIQTDDIKFWAAKMIEEGARLVNIQHGGGYGMVQYCSYEYLERNNCDAFVSWGWSSSPEVIPAPSILACERVFERTLSKEKKPYKSKKNFILWAANEPISKYLPWVGSYINDDYEPYYEFQREFINQLEQKISSRIVMRLRPNSIYLDNTKNFSSKIKVVVPEEKGSFFRDLDEAKLLLSDNLHTTFLYGLVFNVPTVLMCCNIFWKVREEAQEYFSDLREVGIYHDSPESAATMLNRVYEKIDEWWFDQKLQSVRKKFCDQYVRVNSTWLYDWKNVLLSVAKADYERIKYGHCLP